jgi:putative tricarboxylic transport membrane protein
MDILGGFATLFSDPAALAFTALAALLGVVIGALPGLTAAAAIAMLVPLTYYLEPLPALAFLYVIGKSGRYGGSVSAILFNTPGTTASVATMIDGHPMARRGEATRALRMATVASVCGDLVGDAILIFGAVTVARWTARFGPPDYFAVYAMAFLVIGSVVGRSVLKGLLATGLGIAAALVGLDPITGQARWTFGSLQLEGGLRLVPLLVGLFVISELMVRAERAGHGVPTRIAPLGRRGLGLRETLRVMPVIGRSALYGSAIGIMPGLGSSVAAFVAYGEEKRRAGPDAGWGEGALAGVAAPEAANNAVSGPSMIPLLTLGVPGTTVAAILMGVFLIHGIPIGPTIFAVAGDLVFGLFAAGLLGIVLYGAIGWFFGPAIGVLIARLPAPVVYAAIFLVTVIAAYSARLSLWDAQVMLVAGLAGYAMRRLGFPLAAFIIAFILAPGAEQALRQSLLLSREGWWIFATEPVAAAFLALGAGVALWRGTRGVRRPGKGAGR